MEKETYTEFNPVVLCKRCHRRLKDPKAIQLGYGETCYAKVKQKAINYLFEVPNEVNR